MRHSVYGIFFERAAGLEAAGQYDRALELLYQARRWSHADADWWQRLGILSLRLADPAWLASHGLEHGHLGDMAATNAEVYLLRACELAPTRAAHWFWLGWVRHALNVDEAGARQAFERALALDPRQPYALAAIARLALADESPKAADRAIAALESAVAILPESARLHYDLGLWHARAGDEASARRAFERAVACAPLAAGGDAAADTLDREFHADGEGVRSLIGRYYPALAPRDFTADSHATETPGD